MKALTIKETTIRIPTIFCTLPSENLNFTVFVFGHMARPGVKVLTISE